MAEDLDQLLGINPSGNPSTSLDKLLGLAPSQGSFSSLDSFLGLERPSALAIPEEPGFFTEFGRGTVRGVRGLKTEGLGLGAVFADLFGADETALELGALAQANQLEIQQTIPRAVEFENAFDSPGNFALFAASALGEQVPVIASIILSGGIGGLVGRLIGKRLISRGMADLTLQKFGTRGAVAGVVTGATAIETGATATEQFGAVGEISPGVALSAGIAKGALEAIVPFALARSLRILPGQADDLLARIAGALDRIPSRVGRAGVAALVAGPIEGTTEFLQEAIDIAARDFVDANFDALSPDTRDRLLEAAFTGALVGTIFGGIGGAVSQRGQDVLEEDLNDLGLPVTNLDETSPLTKGLELAAPTITAPVIEEPAELPLYPLDGTRTPPEDTSLENKEKHAALLEEPVSLSTANDQGASREVKESVGKVFKGTAREELDTETVEAFTKLGDDQRGKPEQAMLKVQFTMGGGVLNPVVEHVGDLTHRMSHMAKYNSMGLDEVAPKVRTVLSTLKSGFGFEREMNDNIRVNAEVRKVKEEVLRKDIDKALSTYADEHKKLKVYNRPQWLAREAAVAVGRQDFPRAIRMLEKLQGIIDSGSYETATRVKVPKDKIPFDVPPGGKIPPIKT